MEGRDRASRRASARFLWDLPSDVEVEGFARPAPETHRVSLLAPEGGKVAAEAVLGPGEIARMPDGSFEITALEFLPDFSYDAKAKKATSRSGEPNNPALRVAIRDLKTGEESARWLFANMPDFGHGEGQKGPRFVYRTSSPASPLRRNSWSSDRPDRSGGWRRGGCSTACPWTGGRRPVQAFRSRA